MLNRIFIFVGLVAILVVAGAFVVPGFVTWEDYRERLQQIAAETVGAPVAIGGDIDFALLPEPQMRFAQVTIGDPANPLMTVAQVDARFSLVDFFRDHYTLTGLVLTEPTVDLRLDESGRLDAGLLPSSELIGSVVTIPAARVVAGRVLLSDARNGASESISGIEGDVRLETLRGPFGFQGRGVVEGQGFSLRLATGALDDAGETPLSLFLQPEGQGFSLTAEGAIAGGERPSFAGSLTFRQPPAQAAAEDVGRGDLVAAGALQLSADRALFSNYTVTPDENRPATRLTGTAEVSLGVAPRFNAVISGASLALPPRDATVETGVRPLEVVRLLAELPAPPMPPIPGTIGVGINEVNLRAFTLRNLRVDATQQDGAWQIRQLSAALPGNSLVSLTGTLTPVSGRTSFAGRVTVSTPQVGVLAQLWRAGRNEQALLGVGARFESTVALVGETLSLSRGKLTVDGAEHGVSAEIGFGSTSRHLNLDLDLAPVTAAQSAALAGLLPEASLSAAFGLTFPRGQLNLRLADGELLGLSTRDFVLDADWEGGVVAIDRLSVGSLGGVGVDARLTVFGSLDRPEISGEARLDASTAAAACVQRLFDMIGAPAPVRDYLGQWFPADLDLRLDAPSGEGGQEVSIEGQSGAAQLRLEARVAAGFLRALRGPLSVNLDLVSDDPAALSRQLGLGEPSLTPQDQPMRVVAIVEGTPSNSLEATLRVEGGTDSLAFAGNVVVSNPARMSGNGTVRATLSDPSGLVAQLGAEGIDLPPLTGTARLDFDGAGTLRLEQISGNSGGQPVAGALTLSDGAGETTVTGSLEVGEFSPAGLLGVLAGRQALLPAASTVWPDGPISLGPERRTSGRVAITSPALISDQRLLLEDVQFELDWDAGQTRLRQFSARAGAGTVTLDATLCCAGAIPDKRLFGRLSVDGVAVDALLPASAAVGIEGTISGAARFDSTGADFSTLLEQMTGDGSYSVSGLVIEQIAPDAFARAAALEDVLDTDALVLTAALVDGLDDGSLPASDLQGSFTVAGGVLRSPNLQITGTAEKLFGSISLDLASLGLGGGFTMTPLAPPPGNDLLNEAMAQIGITLTGTLLQPLVTYDAAGMVEAMKARALEQEVERLEQLRAEDEARQQAAAAERARLEAEAAARREAEEEARREAERQAAEAEARRRAEAEAAAAAAQQEQSTDIVGPLDLGLGF